MKIQENIQIIIDRKDSILYNVTIDIHVLHSEGRKQNGKL